MNPNKTGKAKQLMDKLDEAERKEGDLLLRSFLEVVSYEFMRYLLDPKKALANLEKMTKQYPSELKELKNIEKNSKGSVRDTYRDMSKALDKNLKKFY
jgi:hypothetical protein